MTQSAFAGFRRTGLLISMSLLGASCSHAVVGAEDETVTASEAAVVGVDTFLYFRSNASGWDANAATRLRPTLTPNVFRTTYPVTQSWMVTNGDNATFTETNQLDGWGTASSSSGSSVSPLVVPGGASIAGSASFIARYQSLGTFQFSVDAGASPRTFSIQAAPPARRWEPNPTDVAAITTIAVAPQNRNQMVVGYTNGDIFLTFQGLSPVPTWTKIDTFVASGQTFELPGLSVNALVIGPGDGKTIYAAFAGTQQGRKLWKTGTGGASWIELPNVPVLPIASLSLNTTNPQRVYAVADGGSVATSDDGGSTWTTAVTPDPLTPPIAPGGRITAVTPNDLNNPPNQVWVGTSTGEIFVGFGLPGAQSWSRVNAASMPARLVTRLTVSPQNLQPPQVWATFLGLLNDSIWLTSNGGQIWLNRHNPQIPTTPIPVSVLSIYGASVNPVDANVVYANDSPGNANRTEDQGSSWLHRSQ